MQIRRHEWPWVYEQGNKPSVITVGLEALAILVALKIFCGTFDAGCDCNRGNGAALNNLMTTKFSASAVIMGLASYHGGQNDYLNNSKIILICNRTNTKLPGKLNSFRVGNGNFENSKFFEGPAISKKKKNTGKGKKEKKK